jgi:hypothetical protein
MNVKPYVTLLVPVLIFLLLLVPPLINCWWVMVDMNYRNPANESCGMAHGYAIEFKKLKGRAPSEEKFKDWATSRFSEDVRRMRLDQESGEVSWKDSKRR